MSIDKEDAPSQEIIRFEVSEAFLENCATGSLTGSILALNKYEWPEAVVLVFPQTSTSWRRDNNGPKHYVIPEFTPLCLIDGILTLRDHGVEVTIEEVERD